MIIETYILPSYWASALINGDYSGYTDEEIEEIKEFLSFIPRHSCYTCSEESYFSGRNDANNMGCEVSEYDFIEYEDY